MKNKEKYVDDIIAIASNGYNIAVRRVYEQVVGCEATDCRDCVFLEGNCAENRQKWFESEAAPTIDELKSELETLKKERDELRARLEKAVELPCKLGGDVYSVRWSKDNPKDGIVVEECVSRIEVDSSSGFAIHTIEYEPLLSSCIYYNVDWNDTVFATRAEAEARLKELQGGER